MKVLRNLLVCLAVLSFFHVFPSQTLANMSSRAIILMNLSTGRILYGKNLYMPIPPASLTKVMSMFVALDLVKENKISLNKTTKVSSSAARTGGSRMRLKKGETITIDKLMMGMAVSSGNNASLALAQSVAGTGPEFIKLMNQKAKRLGMRNSTFKTPHGLPAKGQYTTAYDMLKMARSYIRAHPTTMDYHSTRSFRHNNVLHKSTNRLLGQVKGLYGLKTGYTRASGFNLIFLAKRNGVTLLGVILGGPSRVQRDLEAMKLLEAGFASPNSSAKVARALKQPKYSAVRK